MLGEPAEEAVGIGHRRRHDDRTREQVGPLVQQAEHHLSTVRVPDGHDGTAVDPVAVHERLDHCCGEPDVIDVLEPCREAAGRTRVVPVAPVPVEGHDHGPPRGGEFVEGGTGHAAERGAVLLRAVEHEDERTARGSLRLADDGVRPGASGDGDDAGGGLLHGCSSLVRATSARTRYEPVA